MTIRRDTLRWNGWGRLGESIGLGRAREEAILDELGRRLGRKLLRGAEPCALADVRLPPPKLEAALLERLRAACGDDGVGTSRFERARFALGKSLPDLLRLRRGEIDAAPDVVVHPADEGAVAAVLRIAGEGRLAVVPCGGGTSVVGGVEARPGPGHAGVIVLDTTRLDRLLAVDAIAGTATFQAGIDGPALEAALARHGRTLGHYPQSFEHSTLGGWIATRSSGQQSNGYGAIEDMVVAVRLVTPEGVVRTLPVPRSAAGPDLRQLALGSEGALGVIVEATLRTARLPASRIERGMLFRSFADGVAAVRELVQAGLPVSLVRLSDESETELFELLRRKPGSRTGRTLDPGAVVLGAAARLGYAPGRRTTLLYGVEAASAREASFAAWRVRRVLRRHGGLPLGRAPGRSWRRDRFRTPYLRDWLLDHGVAVDTLETALPWSLLEGGRDAILLALRRALASHAGGGLAMAHLSHSYPDGASLYFTLLYPLDETDAVAQWRAIKRAASDAVVAAGGTISHHHGVGVDHAPWLEGEKGRLGLAALRAVKRVLDPAGLMNPGKLL
ncbi:MAG TPA: FAD-binding oxidoreductase [Myxococcota bacterium]|nr:FAD-binding oxidoreductase [Myxococcota bacterium]